MAYDSTNFDKKPLEAPTKPAEPVIADPIISDPVERVLRRARDLILTKGWGQCKYYETDHSTGQHYNYCTIGALRDAVNYPEGSYQSYAIAQQVMKDSIPFFSKMTYGGGLEIYNDTHKKKDVVRLFDRAIDRRVKQLKKESEQQ